MRLLSILAFILAIVLTGVFYSSHQKTQALRMELETSQLAEEAVKKQAREDEVMRGQQAIKLQEEQEQAEKQRANHVAALQAKVAEMLFDAGSAQFRNLKLNTGKSALCGELNAKNKMGGYVGFRPFVATDKDAAVWNGGKCDRFGKFETQSACFDEEFLYFRAALSNDCKTQEELNLLQ